MGRPCQQQGGPGLRQGAGQAALCILAAPETDPTEGGLAPAPYVAHCALTQRAEWAVPRCAHSPGKGQGLVQSIFPPNQWSPQLLDWALPSPCSGVPLIPQFPPSGLPRLTLPLPSPHPQPVHLAQVSFVIPAFNSNFTLDLELNQ